ncbi:MAG: lamin tail domain-containing protein [Fimbriimonadaceae bacterium]|nr:lamin tail domain-containing protein [Chitinophagales bacterium]
MKRIISSCIFYVLIVCAQQIAGQTVAISEFHYNPDSSLQSQDWVELHNYGGASIDISNWKLRDETPFNSFTFPGGTVLSAGEFLIAAQRTDTFAMVYPFVTNVVGPFEFGFDNTLGSVRLYDAGGSLIRAVNYVDSLPWPNGADGLGPTVEILDYEGDENDPANWIAGCVGGSPGEAYMPCDYAIVISEINYNSAADFNMKQWIELWNKSAGAIDISGWQFRDNNAANIFTIGAGNILNANERLVIADSLEAMGSFFPSVTNIIGEFNFGLSNNGDAVRLYDADLLLQYSVRYDDEFPWPTDADGAGFTIELYVEDGNPNVPSTWVAGCPHGSPGGEFILPCPDAIHDIEANENSIHAQPNPFSDMIVFLFDEKNVFDISALFILNITGEKIIDLPITNTISWNGKDADGNTVASGIYFLNVVDKTGNVFSEKVIKFNPY